MPAKRPTLKEFFGPRGLLQRAYPGYENRPGQLEMAEAVAAALAERRHLIVEAGTGTGKTLAYLLPALYSGRRVLISTGTKNLQEQLVNKDVPLLARALHRRLNVVCMKGRQNYACKFKVEELERQPNLLDQDDLDHYQRLRAWAAESQSGDQAELTFLRETSPLWQRLNARRETCTGSKCPRYDQCFLTLLHQRAAAADLVVVNHHLFFADLTFKRQELPGVLPPYEAVVLDEAHELEAIASRYFATSVSSHTVEDLGRDAAVTLRAEKLATPELEQRQQRMQIAAQALWMRLGLEEGRRAFSRRAEFLQEHSAAYDECLHAIAHLESGLDTLPDKPETIHNLIARLRQLRAHLAFLFESEEEGTVYSVERRGRTVEVQAAPLDVAKRLNEMLFEATDTVVLTSATLAVGGGFGYIRERLGLQHGRESQIASPYDFARQSLLYLPTHLPLPASERFIPAAAEEIATLLEASAGRAFVLCTSYRNMQALYDLLEPRINFPLLLQGTAPRHQLLERFRAQPGAVLIATSSFWQGVDVQGEQLSCVIVDKLPFAPPGDPAVEARIHLLRQQGRNPFDEFQVPRAVLELKQGFGRLIRSSRDCGVLALLDTRISTMRYGQTFLASLPAYARTSSLDDVRAFFAATPLASAAR